MQDVGGLGHFHHEGGAPAGDVIRRSHASEDAIHRPQYSTVGGHKASGVGQQGNKRSLAHVSGLTAHVGARNHQHPAFCVHQQVVGHERFIKKLLHHRMAAILNIKSRGIAEFRCDKTQGGGSFGKIGDDIQLCQRLRCILQRCELFRDGFQHFIVECFLSCQRPAFGTQGFVFEFFQLGRDKAFCVFQCLAANVINRRLSRLGPADFNVIAVHPVVANFQGAYAGALFFPGFHIKQILAGVFTDVAQFVQLFVKALTDHATFPDDNRGVVDNGALQNIGQLGVLTNHSGELYDMV